MEKQSKNKSKAKKKQNRRTLIFLGEGARFRQHLTHAGDLTKAKEKRRKNKDKENEKSK